MDQDQLNTQSRREEGINPEGRNSLKQICANSIGKQGGGEKREMRSTPGTMLLMAVVLLTTPRAQLRVDAIDAGGTYTSVLSRAPERAAAVAATGSAAREPRDLAHSRSARRQRLVGERGGTPADRLLLELGRLEHAGGHGIRGRSTPLSPPCNGTDYLRQAVTVHAIRASANGAQRRAPLFPALLVFFHLEALVLPLLASAEPQAVGATASSSVATTPAGAVDLASEIPSFAATGPRTEAQTSLLRARQRDKNPESSGLSGRALALACPFGHPETPGERSARRRRQAFEDRMAYLSVHEWEIELPANRPDISAALESVPRTKHLVRATSHIPSNASQWTADDTAVVNSHMCKAAALGDIASMQRLVLLGADVSAAAPPWDDTPLHAAARFARVAVAEWLLSRGARVQARSVEGWTPLMMAALAGCEGVAAALLARGARADTRAIPPLNLDAIDCCDVVGLARDSPVAARLEAALVATGAPRAGDWLAGRGAEIRRQRLEIKAAKAGVQVTARAPQGELERWETSFGSGKGGREGGYGDYGGAGVVPRNDGDPNRMGHRKRSQLDSIDLLWDRRTQLAKTGIGNTYDDWAEGEEAPGMVQADLEVRAIPAPW